ncbi:hypothetical protein MTO96_017920 [Rhipicephalus appendiculatus]
MRSKPTDKAARLFREHEISSTKGMLFSTSTGEGPFRGSISSEGGQSVQTALDPTPTDEDYVTAVQDHGPSPGEPQPSPRLAVPYCRDEAMGADEGSSRAMPPSWDNSYPRDTCSLYRPSWNVFWQVYAIYLVVVAAMLLVHSQPWRSSQHVLHVCSDPGCLELEGVLATMSNASVEACDDFYGHVCGGIHSGGEFRELQQYSLYVLLGIALSNADPDGYPGDVRPLIYFYKRCIVVMTGPVVDAAEVHSLLAHYNLSVDVFESAARDVVIEHLVRLAAHGDLVPALRVRHVAPPASHSSTGEKCLLEPGSASRLASLDAAILSGQVAALLSKALQFTISTDEVEQAAGLRGNRSSDNDPEFERDTAASTELVDVRRLLSDSPLWVAALNASVPFIEEANFICRVAEPDTVSAELHVLEVAPLHSLRIHLLLCSMADLLHSELRKFDAGFFAAGACIDDLRRMHRVQTWNRLLWLVVQPWKKDLKVREQVHSVREQLLLFVSQSSAPFELKLNITDALRNLSLAYARPREPEDPAVALGQLQSKV